MSHHMVADSTVHFVPNNESVKDIMLNRSIASSTVSRASTLVPSTATSQRLPLAATYRRSINMPKPVLTASDIASLPYTKMPGEHVRRARAHTHTHVYSASYMKPMTASVLSYTH